MTPHNVTIEGAIISADDEANGELFAIRVHIDGSYRCNSMHSRINDYASVKQELMWEPLNVSAGQRISIDCAEGNNAAELAVVLYGRAN